MNSKSIFNGLVFALCCLQVGCDYGKVSPRATEYAQAIYTTTNLQKSEKLAPLQKQIEEDLEAGNLSSSEAKALQRLLNQAADGNWNKAMLGARKLMQDQVTR